MPLSATQPPARLFSVSQSIMTDGAKSLFDASDAALGYAYQWRYALLLLLRRMRESVGARLSLEHLDDIAIDEGEAASTLVQTKRHRSRKASLTDASEDLWKTIRVWCEAIAARRINVAETTFALVTTSEAPADSIARLLRPEARDPEDAERKLLAVAKVSKSTANRAAYDAFKALEPHLRTALVNAMVVLDGAEDVLDLRNRIAQEVMFAADPEHQTAFVERLEGWWFARVIQHLADRTAPPIAAEELNILIGDLRNQFQRDNLPIDFILADPETVDAESDPRTFVAQLRLIAVNNIRIEAAIRDFYRAYEPRSRWVREELLHVGELAAYKQRLIEEWKRFRALLEDELGIDTEEEKLAFGRRFYKWMEFEAKINIRPRCEEPYVMRGSFQMLANYCRVGWHPEFLDRLKHLIAEAS